MGALGYYAKYEVTGYYFKEMIDLTKVVEEWDSGFYTENYIIDSEGIYYESATWSGKTLNYGTLGDCIKRKKFETIENLISTCRSELEYLGQNGRKVDIPVIKGGEFYFVMTVDAEIENEYNRYSSFYNIHSVENGIVTYQYHSVNNNHLCINDKIYRLSIEDFVERMDDTCWYEISGDIYTAAAKKIICLTERIFNMFRKK